MRSHQIRALVGLTLLAGCKAQPTPAPLPPMAVMASRTDDRAVAANYPPLERQAYAALAASPPAPPRDRKLNVLILSGGAQYTSYAAGIINGWREAGTAPNFDVICGISSGSLLATLAFAGPKHQSLMKHVFTQLSRKELFRYEPARRFYNDQSVASAEPLEQLIETNVDHAFLDDVRQAHAQGRRLFIGTTNENTRRLVIWDLGAIASSGRPDADQLVRGLMLASASIPGLVPTVAFNVQVDGVCYQERHTDGGSSAESFLRLPPDAPRPDPANPAKPWLAGSNLYVIAGGKLYVDPYELKPTFQDRTVGTISSTLHALHREDVWKMYAYCAASGMKFNQTYIPKKTPIPAVSTTFDVDAMQLLYREGYTDGYQGVRWRQTPPGVEPGEEELPRAGFVFTTQEAETR